MTDAERAAVEAALASHGELAGPLLPILHAVQAQLGYVPPTAYDRLAAALNVSRAEVYGVVSYYHDFRSAPAPAHELRVCRGEACQAMGAEALLAHARVITGVGCDAHGAGEGAGIRVAPVYCLGLCSVAPSATLDGRLRGRLDKAALDQFVAETRMAESDLEPTP